MSHVIFRKIGNVEGTFTVELLRENNVDVAFTGTYAGRPHHGRFSFGDHGRSISGYRLYVGETGTKQGTTNAGSAVSSVARTVAQEVTSNPANRHQGELELSERKLARAQAELEAARAELQRAQGKVAECELDVMKLSVAHVRRNLLSK